MSDPEPLIRKVDAVQMYVPDLEEGLRFYRDVLGHRMLWRTDTAAGLGMPDSDAEIVIQTERQEPETDLTVDSAHNAAQRILDAGGRVIVPPFETQIGFGTVVEDPWGNRMVLLDLSKGLLATDSEGKVIGNLPS